ncbi:MAG: hypothetical protein PUB21_11230 [Bacteroidales bacterium]|nr:hypothetical protein [Bacteroidales bacterium]
MKKIGFSIACSIISTSLLFAQAEMDAYRYSQTELSGSARSVAMGGAFGALGGDISVLNSNPAGLGVYQSSELSTTFNFMNNVSKADLNGLKTNDSRFTFSLDNIGAALSFNVGNKGNRLNFGFSYNKLFSFNNRYRVYGNNLHGSMLDYITQMTNRFNGGNGVPAGQLALMDEGSDPFASAPWLSVLAYNTFLMNPKSDTDNSHYTPALGPDERINNEAYIEEKGSISEYSFALGGSLLENHLYLGASFVLSDIDYRLETVYDEFFQGPGKRGFGLDNWFSTEGTGFNMKLGAIIRPINALRIGVAYHTPTWYSMTDYFDASMYPYNIETGEGGYAGNISTPANNYATYNFRTPDKWVVSAAGILGKSAIISADWEIVNYRHMNMDYAGSYVTNDYIEQDFRTASTLRVGAEIKITQQFSVRGGAAFRTSPMKTEVRDAVYSGNLDIPTAGTIPNFTVDKGSNTYTFGLGYRFNRHFYLDMACALMRYNYDYYNFSPLTPDADGVYVASDPASLKTYRTKVLCTFGYKF